MNWSKSRWSFGAAAFALTLTLAAPIALSQQENFSAVAELTSLVRNLRAGKSLTAYAALKRFAEAHTAQPLGARAALALGHYDYTNNRNDSAIAWLTTAGRGATRDPLLADYAQFLLAQAERAAGRPAAAVTRLEEMLAAYPRSLLAVEAREALALAALAAGQPGKTVDLLATARAPQPALLLARAQAYEKLGTLARAAQDYNAIYFQFPLAPEAATAAGRINALRGKMRGEFPAVPADWPSTRVQEFIDEKRCSDARKELKRLGPVLAAAARDVLEVRVTGCMKRGQPAPAAFEKLRVADPAANAERLFALSQAYRSKGKEDRMIAAVEEAALRHPSSRFTESALLLAGNYYWARFDHARAALYYQRLLDTFPESENARAAHWRIAWLAWLENAPRAKTRLEEHLRRFRGSPFTENALYWLGRFAERNEHSAEARAFYVKAVQRFPQTYYGQQSAERLRALGAGDAAELEVLSAVNEPRPAMAIDSNLSAEALERRARARALRSIALDTYAERELIAAFQETRHPALLLEAAQLAANSSRYYDGVLLGRRLVPQLESRRLPDLPEEIWRAVYPYVYGEGIAATAGMAGLDPMLVAGLIRQESVFEAGAVSRAGACGLMQVMPKTGKQLARQLRLSYSRKRLFQPDFNLRLGTTHLARLVREFDSVEAALAAYNAGEARVESWRAGRTFSEPAAFVESIPFTETREYVQIVLRNRSIYRALYGAPATAASAAASASSN